MSQKETPLNLSRHQYGTLKFIRHHAPTLAYLRKAHANTLGSLLHPSRAYLRITGKSEGAVVLLSPAGEDAYKNYEQASMNERSHEKELTERCMRLLQLSRRKSTLEMPAKSA